MIQDKGGTEAIRYSAAPNNTNTHIAFKQTISTGMGLSASSNLKSRVG